MPSYKSKTPIRIGHSPDPDDAFMWYPLAKGPDGKARIDTGPYDFIHVLEDIQSLNERSERGELEITALSIHQYPYVAQRYALTTCGSSMGDNYGPMVVARQAIEVRDLITPLEPPPDGHPRQPHQPDRLRLAIPGTRTTAWLAMQLRLLDEGVEPGDRREVDYSVVMFDQIIDKVASGQFDAGLIIHEGQLTYAGQGLKKIVDLGEWWTQKFALPLPLGGNAIRRDLGEPAMREICTILLRSIQYALEHRDEAVAYALQYARGMDTKLADQFVGMYVNQWTLDYGQRGRAAVSKLLAEAADAKLTPDTGEIDFVEPL